jgi:hypothetical protein
LNGEELEEKDPEPGIFRLFPDLFLNLLQGPGDVSFIQKLFGIQSVSPLMRLLAWLSIPAWMEKIISSDFLIWTHLELALFSALPLKVCHKKQEKFHPTLETIDGKEP